MTTRDCASTKARCPVLPGPPALGFSSHKTLFLLRSPVSFGFMPTPSGLPTLADQLDLGHTVFIDCRQCGRCRRLNLAQLIAAGYGAMRPSPCRFAAPGAAPAGSRSRCAPRVGQPIRRGRSDPSAPHGCCLLLLMLRAAITSLRIRAQSVVRDERPPGAGGAGHKRPLWVCARRCCCLMTVCSRRVVGFSNI